jgi:leader peptidase (prepilin peptidase)/N-methyltransferase
MRIALAAVLGIALGAALGSYAGVVAARGWRASLNGRSRCDTCGASLVWYELVPLISFVALRGHCRTCGQPLRWRVYGWEAGGAVLGLAVCLPIAFALMGG